MAKKWIFVPVNDNDVVDALASSIQNFVGDALDVPVITKPGETKLGAISQEQDPELYVVGHGNFGQGIGSHKEHYGAWRLEDMLWRAGLGKTQNNLTIHLVACNSGVAMRRNHLFARRESYAKRFADNLARLQYSGIKVVGYAGFINREAKSTLASNRITKTNGSFSPVIGYGALADRQVIYTVGGGHASKTVGSDWKSYTAVSGRIHIENS